jgi:hypothetical protein
VISLEEVRNLAMGRASGSQFQEIERYIFVNDTSTLALWTWTDHCR